MRSPRILLIACLLALGATPALAIPVSPALTTGASPTTAPARLSTTDVLVGIYGQEVTAELDRLRENADRRVFFVLDAGIGYVQCEPKAGAIYCEAAAADGGPALSALLTPDRIARLTAAGYESAGRSANFARTYPLAQTTDRDIARQLLALLYDAYDYTGAAPLTVTTEAGKEP